MPGAIVAFDQARPSGPSFGTPGVARNDLWEGRQVTGRCTTSGNTSFAWVLLDAPAGSAVSLTGAATANVTFTPDLPGSYLLQLTTNGGGPGNVMILVAAVRFDFSGVQVNRGWRVPALGEIIGQANFGGQTRGWSYDFEFILADIRASLGGGGAGVVVAVKQPVITADYVCVNTDYVIPVDTVGGGFFVDLLTGAPVGQRFEIIDEGGHCSLNNCVVRPPGGEDIVGTASYTLAADFAGYVFTKVTATRWGIS